MFIVLLKLSENRVQASRLMEERKAWIRRGFDDGVFVLLGSQPRQGGGVLAHDTSLAELEARESACQGSAALIASSSARLIA
jgi:hypothetical protein